MPTKVSFTEGDVNDLKAAIKTKLEPKLKNVAVDNILLRKHGETANLKPKATVDSSFENTPENSLQVIVYSK